MNAHLNKALAAALLTACAAAAAASAEAAAGIGADTAGATVVVALRDLDLDRPEGRATLEGRLRAAARSVCGAPEREEVRAIFARRDCYRQSVERAMSAASAGSPLVADLR